MSRVPLPFGSRHPLLGLPVPPRASAPLTIGLPALKAGTRRGFHVPRIRDATGEDAPVMFSAVPQRGRWPPGPV